MTIEQQTEQEWQAIRAAEIVRDREKRSRAIADGSIVPEADRDQRGEWVIRELGLRVFPLVAPSSPPLPRPRAELPDLDVWSADPFAPPLRRDREQAYERECARAAR